MAGFAVIDVETTGFAYAKHDRICEIGVVLLSPDGQVEHTYTTLVNPQRDLGAQHIHGIDATEARFAPTFEAIVGDLSELVAGRVIAAHNATFDTAFLNAEYARAGWPIGLTADQAICTMRLARTIGAPAKLVDCCAHLGINLPQAHAALADAEAAAGVLTHVLARSSTATFTQWLEWAQHRPWPTPPAHRTPPVCRGVSTARPDALVSLASNYESLGEPEAANEYLDLLARVLADRKISTEESRALAGLASTLGLTPQEVEHLNRHYLVTVVDAALADGVFSAHERAAVIQLAGLLGLSEMETHALVMRGEMAAQTVERTVDLKPGDLIVLTGMSEARKRELTVIAQRRGLVVWGGVKKGVAAVIAQDVGSNSGKARKAREYGIPVVGEEVLG